MANRILETAVLDNLLDGSICGWLKFGSNYSPIDPLLVFSALISINSVEHILPHSIEKTNDPSVFRFVLKTSITVQELLCALANDSCIIMRCCDGHDLPVKLWRPIEVAAKVACLQENEQTRLRQLLNPLLFADSRVFGDNIQTSDKSTQEIECSDKTGEYREIYYSNDATSVMGRLGHLFLYQGSNRLYSQYIEPPPNSDAIAYEWQSLVAARSSFCSEMDSEFLQIIIPEKSSVLPGLYPLSIKTPTSLYDRLSQLLCHQQEYFDAYRFMNESPIRNYFFAQTDSHLTSLGASHLVSAILLRLGFQVPLPFPSEFTTRNLVGDLVRPGPFQDWSEEQIFYSNVSIADHSLVDPILISQYNPDNSHIGISRQWRNESPLVEAKVLVFGNSFFERGGTSKTLCWWFSRIFRHLVFVWTPILLASDIEKHSPDIVVCQTVERFLPVVPRA